LKNVLITGADRGLGYALCEGFLSIGWRVFAGRFMPEWTQLEELGRRFPERLIPIPLDVGDSRSAGRAAAGIAGTAGGIDLLVQNAGITGIADPQREILNPEKDYLLQLDGLIQESSLTHAFDINALGALRVVRAMKPLMDAGMKRLCFVSSEAGSIAASTRRDYFAYTMSKAALNAAVRRMHRELSPQGYTFRLYHPGWLRTYMSGKKNLQAALEPEESAKAALRLFLEEKDSERVLELTDNQGAVWPF
jgi:NAD(P)-dependent dehydrogenase (short-subunit alcohol dehydrogenase family)